MSSNYTITKSNITTVQSGDPDWMMLDGVITTPRAGFEISNRCPDHYKYIILDCINRGWLKPIAHLYDYERTYEKLKYE